MKPTDVLMSEHRGIERMMVVVEKAANRLEAGKDVPPDIFLNAADFFSNFADKCHHGKEENELFPAMEKAGVPRQGGPIGVMLAEHDQGRAFIRSMKEASTRYRQGDASAKSSLIDAVRGYVNLLRNHIYKEDNILFPMANAALPASEESRLTTAFDHIEETVMGPGVHERYHQMIDDMEKQTAGW